MLRILANDHHVALALDDLALVADLLYGRLNFQCVYHLSCFSVGRRLFAAPRYPALRRVVDRHLDLHLVPEQDLDVVLTEFAGDVRGDHHIILQLDFEERVRELLHDYAFKFHDIVFLFRQNNLSSLSLRLS